jgi:hypothetical protein
MAKSFDFNKIKPKTMTVTLSDEAKTVLAVMTPDKKLRDDLVSLYEGVDEGDDDEIIEALYDLSARVMSRNKQGIDISADQLKEMYPDHTYVMAFLNAYVDFIGELTNSKN